MATSELVTARRHPAGFLEARPRPGSGRRGEVLAGFLQSDVQADLATAQAFLDEIAGAARGGEPQPGGTGNAFSITGPLHKGLQPALVADLDDPPLSR